MVTASGLPASNINLPVSSATVTVQALDTTLCLYVRSANFLDPVIPGHEAYNCPVLAFLVTHTAANGSIRRVLFDAGGRKDYWNYSPLVTGRFKSGFNVFGFTCPKDVNDVLCEAGIMTGGDDHDVEAVVWSHWHFDHIGDMSRFSKGTKIVVGPGFKANLLPGFPLNPESPLLETDYAGRELDEITFDSALRIGAFRAHDYFGDGSFYLLDVPGHAVGHMCGLARTTEESFVIMGADTCHFAGALRPSPTVPFPDTFDVNDGLDPVFNSPCPCTMFLDCHPASTDQKSTPYYKASKTPGSAYVDPHTADMSIAALRDFDADPNVFVGLAHDPALFEILPLLNTNRYASINDWKANGYKAAARWRFLNELPRNGKPGRPPLVMGWWRGAKRVTVQEAFAR
ncbi:hypothetical protein LTR62_002996 [Meristemomyces frigidus]|uniref:Metallo-beta-lactamase domain-containing protein n=1 Tax=Meristemomyces frigidus TaxID=1508187 RepID=A0AAN7TPY3_9PEZI|nr:hypothetical protein LTR62_002996 [Meristemomyces frigidus]